MKVVPDTNVLLSGIFFSGPPANILRAWQDKEIRFVLSPEIIEEYFRAAGYLASKFPDIEINSILNSIVTHSEIIHPVHLPHQVCEDPDDDKFLACALTSSCKIIISGDKHLLKLSGYQRIRVLTPRAFVEQYLKK